MRENHICDNAFEVLKDILLMNKNLTYADFSDNPISP